MSYLERLKAKMKKNQPQEGPTKGAKPAKAPFAPFVGIQGTHICEKKEPAQITNKTSKRALAEGETFPLSCTPMPLSSTYPCVICGRTERWDDAGIWRCRHCWGGACR